MNKNYKSAGICAKIWLLTATFLASVAITYMITDTTEFKLPMILLFLIVFLIASLPALIVLLITLPIIQHTANGTRKKITWLIISLFLITVPYGLLGGAADFFSFFLRVSHHKGSFTYSFLLSCCVLFACSLSAMFTMLRPLYYYFNEVSESYFSYSEIFKIIFYTSKNNTTMESEYHFAPVPKQSNKILIKGLITGALILIMLIPTLFINNLISEREARQKEVVKEVSSKWASSQTLSGPFLTVPYNETYVNSEGKNITARRMLLLLANDLTVTGKIMPEQRPRSIYKVLLYKADVTMKGVFKVQLPADIIAANIDYANAKLCFSLTDFKGIEQAIYVNFNGANLLLSPGMPVTDFGNVGLSVAAHITAESLSGAIPFSMKVKLKGSEQLHFMPLSATSSFQLSSAWPSPSFDGDMLPGERAVSDSGFTARWNFNQANLPFGTVLKDNMVKDKAVAFGVSLVQPADQYDKTNRSVKYAILFIGLTFAFFFIIELMQNKPFHPVQYVLVGLALVIFYTLLLSISEYILFDYAYLFAALATVLLISFYAKGHFNSWKTAGVFFALLSCLYGFIFVLIRLEDTALLVGSIGLFIVLALVMYASRKISWYGSVASDIPPAILQP